MWAFLFMEKSTVPNTIFESGIHNESPSIYYKNDRDFGNVCQRTQHCREKRTPIDTSLTRWQKPMGAIHGDILSETQSSLTQICSANPMPRKSPYWLGWRPVRAIKWVKVLRWRWNIISRGLARYLIRNIKRVGGQGGNKKLPATGALSCWGSGHRTGMAPCPSNNLTRLTWIPQQENGTSVTPHFLG